MRHALRCLCLLLLTCASHVGLARAGTTWHLVELGGSPAGWLRTTISDPDDPTVRTEQAMLLEVHRDGSPVKLRFESWFEETRDGVPIRMGARQRVGAGETFREARFDRDHLRVITEQGGRRTESREPLPKGPWLPPAAARRYVEQRAGAGADRITLRTIDPLSGLAPVAYERVRAGTDELEVFGRTIATTRWTVTTTPSPGVPSTEWIDADGLAVRTEASMGELRLTMRLATEAEATGEREPPELLTTTFVRPSRAIEHPRHVRSASYVLRIPGGEMPDVADAGAQRSERLSPEALRVTVDLDASGSSTGRPRRNEARRDAPSLAATTLLDHKDPAVRTLVRQATAGTGEGGRENRTPIRAEAMRRFVYDYITDKHLDVAFGTASETARSRAGDCTEHAALLAAMLRADAIPARLVIGLIYADRFAGERDIFAYHMWVRALVMIDGQARWVDLDATLPRDTPFDATHIAIVESSGENGLTDAGFARLVPLMGRLQIEVERVEHAPSRREGSR
ncbi:MAG: transglutaminase family protein [Phycisphaerales bacterium]|nr:MAG: transglutaminase family protein [Phycisphaerales bacterium]